MKCKMSILLLVMIFASSTAVAETKLSIVGSNTLFPIVEAVGARFQELNPDVTISVEGPGSGAGITALIDRQTDIAPMSREPKQEEVNEATAKGIELNITKVALDALIIVVNKENPIDSLTREQITGIYNGTYTNWADVGWASGGDIFVIERDENSGTHDFFNEFFLDGEEVDPAKVKGHKQEASTSQLFRLVADQKNAIGYGGLAFFTDIVKKVKVDGVEGTIETAKDGSYPVARPLFYVFDEKTISDIGRQFVEYTLSPEGQYLVLDVGYVNVAEAAQTLSEVASIDNTPLNPLPLMAGIVFLALVFRKKSFT